MMTSKAVAHNWIIHVFTHIALVILCFHLFMQCQTTKRPTLPTTIQSLDQRVIQGTLTWKDPRSTVGSVIQTAITSPMVQMVGCLNTLSKLYLLRCRTTKQISIYENVILKNVKLGSSQGRLSSTGRPYGLGSTWHYYVNCRSDWQLNP